MTSQPPRVPLLDLTDARGTARGLGLPEAFAELSVFRILLRHPALAQRLADLLQTLLFTDHTLDPRLRELIILRIGWRTRAVYEWTQHWRVARGLDIPENDLLAVRRWREATGLSDADRAVLQATDDTLDLGAISDATWDACCRHLATDQERIELVIALGNWSMFSQLLRSLQVPLEDGVAPWPPDGEVPPAGGTP
jgi:alkylhydroperoxidase family enzyme